MICPNCQKAAKKSFAITNCYVCSCLGYLEDIAVISNVIKPQQPKSNLSLTKIYGIGSKDIDRLNFVQLEELLQNNLTSFNSSNLIIVEMILQNVIDNEVSIFKASCNNFNFIITINEDTKLIPDGRYVFFKGPLRHSDLIDSFNAIKIELLRNKEIDPLIFNTNVPTFKKTYNEFWLK